MANAYERHDISDESWAKMELLLPGRRTISPVNDTQAADQRWGDHACNIRFLLTFTGADHMVFSGRRPSPLPDGASSGNDAVFQQLTAAMSLAFLNGFVG